MQQHAQADTELNSAKGSWMTRYMPDDDNAEASSGTTISIAAIRGVLFRQRYIFIGVIITALMLGLLITLLMKPIYSATATVRIDTNSGSIVEGQDLVNPEIGNRDLLRYLNTLASVVQSREMAYQVVDKLNLATNPALYGGSLPKKRAGQTDAQWKQGLRETAASILSGGIAVQVPLDRSIISISFKSPDRSLAAAITNGYVDNFLTDDVKRQISANSYAQNYLQDQISKVRTRLLQSERSAINYARSNKIISQSLISGGDQGSGGASKSDGAKSGATAETITTANLASVNSTYTDARAKRIEAEQHWAAVSSLPVSKIPEVQQDPTIQALVASRANLAASLAQQKARYGADYPAVKEGQAQLSTLDKQIAASGQAVKDGIYRSYQIALLQEQGLAKELNQVSDQTLNEQDRRIQFNQLDRDSKALRVQLDSLTQRYNQISSAANIHQNTITKLDDARVPGAPISPNMMKNMVVALVLGIALSVGIAILREIFDDRVRSPDDVERKLGVPLLGITPMVDEDTLTKRGPNPINEAYASIRTSLDFALPARTHNVLMITSSQMGEGKSTSSVAIAKNFAALGQKVLLVDSDLRKPNVASQFGLPRSKQGFVEVLSGEAQLRDVLLPVGIENLDVLPVGNIPLNPVEVLSSHLLTDFIDKYREEYALILFDSAPVMGLADSPLLSRAVDGVVFVVEANRIQFGQSKTAIRRLRDAHARMLGVVLTKFRALEAGESYDYQYTYYSYGAEKD